jgi:hypothetical protein
MDALLLWEASCYQQQITEIRNLKGYVDALLIELLEVSGA